ncbi:hypothetical protein CBR_g40612 [Chara braunii]|uniref:CCHC-type domain-containing protein n=1 Tax=Chara braunii TaxID=69332 RepID=A0A388LU91_CHABU|nr:hypothetical protein CBR_g40612 [Chara braunii]|eukprot:GBG85803.1 hypothetical protein CBR_g40612 [Chara braunii]
MASHGACFNCNMPGHFARDCPSRQPSFPQQTNGFRSSSPSYPPLRPPPTLSSPVSSQAPLLALPPPPPPSTSQSGNMSPAIVPRQSWWKLNQEKLDRVYEFMASELEARQEAIREKERHLKEEEEKKRAKEAEEKALKKMNDRQDFEDRISNIVGNKINDACELFLGKVDSARIIGERRGPVEQPRLRVESDAERDRLQKQIEQLRVENEWIRKQMEELSRTTKNSRAGAKRPGGGVCIASPPKAPAHGRPRVMGVGTPTSQDFQKLLKAYNQVKDGKRAAALEVQMLKERFERAIDKLVRQGRTPRSNLTKRMNDATDEDDPEQHCRQDDALDDLILRPSPPKRTSGRLATKAAAAERADFLKETKKHLKRLKKQGLQLLYNREGITFCTYEQAINDIAEHRASSAFDFRPEPAKAGRPGPGSDTEDAKEDGQEDAADTQPVNVEEDEQIGGE